jgi:UDP-glucose 4-epimerase
MEQQTILITGGAGFVGSHLVDKLTCNYVVYVLDNFSASESHNVNKEWFLKNPHLVQIKIHDNLYYIKGNTSDIFKLCDHINPVYVFHFGEFSRINESWNNTNQVYHSNLYSTTRVLDYCVQKSSMLFYSASSAPLGGNQNLTPYNWTKSKMIELIKNYEQWYGLKYIIFYFYNVYGPGQISEGTYATVLGIFEHQYKSGRPLTVVSPGTQTRYFTHVYDIISGILLSIDLYNKKELQSGLYIPISSNDHVSLLEVAQKFTDSVEMLPARVGDRQQSIKTLEDILRLKFGWKSEHNLDDWINSVTTESQADRETNRDAKHPSGMYKRL